MAILFYYGCFYSFLSFGSLMMMVSGDIDVIKEVCLVVSSVTVANFAGGSKSSYSNGKRGSLQKVKVV